MPTLAELQALSDSELIEKVATEVMGWTRRYDYWINDNFEFHGWNPLTDWNHWRQVEEKVYGNVKLVMEFEDALGIDPTNISSTNQYVSTDLRTRCIAALLAVG